MIVIDLTGDHDGDRRRRIAEEVRLIKERVAFGVAEYRWRQALDAERVRLARERQDRERRVLVERTRWGLSVLVSFVLGLVLAWWWLA